MQVQLIRNATLKLSYAQRTILIDPFLGPKHSVESFAGRSRNPTVELPTGIDGILAGVELVVVSHLHEDHFDAKRRLPKEMPIFCQPGDETDIRAAGFTDVTPLSEPTVWKGIAITPRAGSHGLGPVLQDMGSVIGFSLEAPGEPSVYCTGDTVLYPPVAETISATEPDVVITHSCGARWNGDLIVMDADETVEVCRLAPASIVIATHMEALDHATVDRRQLRAAAEANGIAPSRLLIPLDGEFVSLTRP